MRKVELSVRPGTTESVAGHDTEIAARSLGGLAPARTLSHLDPRLRVAFAGMTEFRTGSLIFGRRVRTSRTNMQLAEIRGVHSEPDLLAGVTRNWSELRHSLYMFRT